MKLVANSADSWDSLLPFIIFEYNTFVHLSVETCPFPVVFGTGPFVVSLSPPTTKPITPLPVLDPCISGFTLFRSLVAEYLLDAKSRQQDQFNEH